MKDGVIVDTSYVKLYAGGNLIISSEKDILSVSVVCTTAEYSGGTLAGEHDYSKSDNKRNIKIENRVVILTR